MGRYTAIKRINPCLTITDFSKKLPLGGCNTVKPVPNFPRHMTYTPPESSVFDLPEQKKAALISLLTDEDPVVFKTIRDEIMSHGSGVRTWLAPYALDEDPLLRRRTREIVTYFDRIDADTIFHAFCINHGEDLDLEEGCWLLARTVYTGININAYRAILDDYAHDLMMQLDFGSEPEGIVAGINRHLFKTCGFAGNEENYYDPENSYLNRVIDRHTGNPISVCMVYLAVCRRLGLPVTGIGLPGHFLCRYQTPRQELFVDAFNLGRVLTKADCMKYLKQAGYEFHDNFLAPASPRRILLRMCSNLHQVYQRNGNKIDATRLQGYIVALSK
jgi:regulator of sirC expression with transglutaminase-like and TPR domain